MNTGLPLFDQPHDGGTYDDLVDRCRLNAQTERVFRLMADGEWRTLQEISEHTEDPEASVSARLRDLRKRRFGKHDVERRRREAGYGTWEYRLTVNRGATSAA